MLSHKAKDEPSSGTSAAPSDIPVFTGNVNDVLMVNDEHVVKVGTGMIMADTGSERQLVEHSGTKSYRMRWTS